MATHLIVLQLRYGQSAGAVHHMGDVLAHSIAAMQVIPREQEEFRNETPKQEELLPPGPAILHEPRVKAAIAAVLGGLVLLGVAFYAYYTRLGRLIDERLAQGAFANTMDIYSAPRRIAVGDAISRNSWRRS